MRVFAIVLGLAFGLLLLGSIYGVPESFATSCGSPMFSLVHNTEKIEFAIATVTITDKHINSNHRSGMVFFDIDKIKYMPDAKSDILVTKDTIGLYGTSQIEELIIGEQYVVVYKKYRNNTYVEHDDYWGEYSSCFGIYNTNVLDYVEWFETIKPKLDNEKPIHEVSEFEIGESNTFTKSPNSLSMNEKIFIGLIKNMTTVQTSTINNSIILKNVLTFDVIFNYLNTGSEKISAQYPAWQYNNEMVNPEKGKYYFIHLRTNYIHEYWDRDVSAEEEYFVTLVPLENSYELIKGFYSLQDQLKNNNHW